MKKSRNPFAFFYPILSWWGRVINTRMRLSIGLAVSVLSLILVAQLFGLLPNTNRAKMQARKLQTETLALTGSSIVETTQDSKSFERTLQNTLKRCDDLRSIGLRNNDGTLDINIGQHDQQWERPENGKSNDRYMFVPIFSQGEQVGQLELCYEPLMSFKSWLMSDVAKLAGFLLLGSFFMFNFILYRTLKQLDPRGAVPGRVREALNNLAEGLLITDRNDRIMLANCTFGELVGVDPEKLTGQDVNRFPWKSESLPWREAMEKQSSVSVKGVQLNAIDGTERTFSVNASPVMGDTGNCRGVMVTFDDITMLEENKRELILARKEADAANEAKSVFLSRMSHEIRTPMNAIIGYTDILRQGVRNENDQAKYLRTIHTSGEHLLDVINDILDLSKIEAGQMTVENRQCRLIPILTQVIETLKIRADQGNLELSLQIDGRVPDVITVDETRLRQVLINTVGNAIKFTKQGQVALFAKMADNGKHIQFDVADTGVGIPAEALKKIFQPFSQADDSVTRKFGGTGLGLAISKQLSETMGGGISVTSEVNVGTVFSIQIDPGKLEDVRWLTNQDISTENQKQEKKDTDTVRFERGHVLIVDDGAANRELAAIMLKRLGLTSDQATNGMEAINKITDNNYDVVLMDVNMPVMDGMTATRQLRESGFQVPIVALTALAVEEDRQKCLDSGCNAFLGKPIRMAGMIEILKEFLQFDSKTVAAAIQTVEVEPANGTPSQTTSVILSQPAPSQEIVPSNHKKSDTTNDIIDDSLSETLAGLGLSDDLFAPAATEPAAPVCSLELPSEIKCTMPLDDPEIRNIHDDFVVRLRQRVPEFVDAWSNNDRAELKNLAHWLAGTAATIGLEDFVQPAKELEYSDWTDIQRNQNIIDFIIRLTAMLRTNSETHPVGI